MFCRKCGKQVGESDVFCTACGQATNATIAVNQPVTTTSATKVAMGVFMGIIAVILVVVAVTSGAAIPIICILLLVFAIFVAAGGLKKHLR